MKKILKWFVVFFLLTIIFVGSITIYEGHKQYKKFIEEKSITELVEEIRNQKTYTKLNEISPLLIKATYYTEDKRLFERKGVVDFRSVGRALWTNFTNWEWLEGGSTIPQQLAKNFYLTYNTSAVDKVSEYFIAKDINTLYSTEEILELYLNIIYYGDGYFGIYEASTGYFDILPNELNDNESTLLAGLPQSPANYELSSYYEVAKIRQQHILNKLVENDIITKEQIIEILSEPIRGDY